MAPVAGGWEAACHLPAKRALQWASDILRERRWENWWKAYQAWCSTLPAYQGSDPPDPPEPPED